MSLTPQQAQHFRQHGFLAVPEFFTPRETAAIRAEVERLKREGYLRNVATDGDGKTTSQTLQNLQLCPMYRQSPLFRAMPFAEKVVEAVRQLLGAQKTASRSLSTSYSSCGIRPPLLPPLLVTVRLPSSEGQDAPRKIVSGNVPNVQWVAGGRTSVEEQEGTDAERPRRNGLGLCERLPITPVMLALASSRSKDDLLAVRPVARVKYPVSLRAVIPVAERGVPVNLDREPVTLAAPIRKVVPAANADETGTNCSD